MYYYTFNGTIMSLYLAAYLHRMLVNALIYFPVCEGVDIELGS